MDKLDKLLDRMTRHMLHYFVAGGLAEPDGLVRTVEFFLEFVDKGKLSDRLIDKQVVEEALIHHIPKHMPLFIDESFYAYQVILDLYFALYNEKIITKEECREMHFFIYLNKTAFLTRMCNPNYWSKAKLAIMDEWREGNFEVEDPYNVKEYDLREKKEPIDNILPFPKKIQATADPKGYVIRVDLKGYKPPIWRRLVIPAEITYERLHRILQRAFDWSGSHLHSFIIDKEKVIGPSELETVQYSNSRLLIDDDFQQKATINYIYDFGCYWEHRITIEEVLFGTKESELFSYAECVKAKGETPMEDSRGQEIWKPFDLADINTNLEKE